jgi:hypothetical protein
VVAAEDESHPEYQALIADAVGIALQVVLDTLNPAERVAFQPEPESRYQGVISGRTASVCLGKHPPTK